MSPSLGHPDGEHAIAPLAAVEIELGATEEILTPRGETPIKRGGALAKAAFFEQFA